MSATKCYARIVPGTTIEYTKKRGNFEFLIPLSTSGVAIESAGYRYLYHAQLRWGRRVVIDNDKIWITALPHNDAKADDVIVTGRYGGTRTYRNAAIAAILEPEIAKVVAKYERCLEARAKANAAFSYETEHYYDAVAAL